MKTKTNGLLVLLFALMIQITFAQERAVSGVVSDEMGPISDISVKVKDSNRGTITDFGGNYSIQAKTGDVLIFSHISYNSKEKIVNTSNNINIQLIDAGDILEEVIVVGYGTTKQRELTTSISKANMNDVQSISTSNVANALQGTVTGIQISSTSGAPGGEVSIRIRGASTITGNSDPLYVIDGIPFFVGKTTSDNFGGQRNSALSNLNSNDIESIEILKDAAAAAIYGSRGSNGVVIITTKTGENGKAKFTFSNSIGIQNPINKLEIMNYGEWLKFKDVSDENSGSPSGSFSANDVGDPTLSGASQDILNAFYLTQANVGDNYLEALYVDNAIVSNTNLSVSGGNEDTKYFMSIGHFLQNGTLLSQDFERKSIRLNLNQKLTEKLSFNGGMSLTDELINQVISDNSIFGGLTAGILERPGFTLRDVNGNFTDFNNFILSNPLQNMIEDKGSGRVFRVLANGELNYKISKNFTTQSKFGIDQSEYIELISHPSTSAQGNFIINNGFAQEDHVTRRQYTLLQAISYNKVYNNFKIRGFFAGEFENGLTKFLRAAAEDFASPDLTFVQEGGTPLTTGGFHDEEKRYSLISRVGATFYNNLIIEGSIRADASSKFQKGDRWGYFPAASIAYIVSDSDWFTNELIDYLKLRASWGITGNDSPFERFNAPSTETSQYAVENAIHLGLGSHAKWEETKQIDFGFNLKLLNNRIGISYSYYTKETNNNTLVIPTPNANSQGGQFPNQNVGSIINKGHEVDLNFVIFDTNNFSWNSTINFSSLDNEILNIAGTSPINSGFVSRVEEGESLGFFHVLEADGLYQDISEVPEVLQLDGVGAGDVKYIDQNDDGIINDEDLINGGDSWADYTLNWKNNISFKNIDLNFLWVLSEGNDIFNNNLRFAGVSGSSAFNKFKDQLDWWTPTNTDTDIPRPNTNTQGYNNRNSTRLVEDGSYIKLRNVTLGYSFPNVKGIDQLRISVSADNLVLITDYSGVDPEVNTFGNQNIRRGIDFFTQGNNQVLKMGLNITF